jgi:cellulose synthase/poly-beta-1,6-N-acetylglucosamine synthase-like glycosyltransferase
MVNLASHVLVTLAVLTTIPVVVFVTEVLAALFVPRTGPTKSPISGFRPRAVILIPAHNEGAGMISTINNIAFQLRSGDRILIVADNCTDDTTAVASSTGVEVVERRDTERRGKGYALDFGIRHLAASPPEILVIMDADCCFSPGSLDILVSTAQARFRPVQALNLMTAPEDQPRAFQFAEFAWRIKNWARPLGLSALRLPCQLTGTGMAFPWEVIRSAKLATGEIVEDLKLGLELAVKGKAPLFCPSARVISHFPSTQAGSDSQRQRWEHGHLNMIAKMAPQLLWKAIANRNPSALCLTLDLMVPPLLLLCVIELVLLSISGLAIFAGASSVSFYVVATSLVALAFSIILCWVRFGRDVFPAKKIVTVPAVLIKKLGLYRRFLFEGRSPPHWIRTDRSKSERPETLIERRGRLLRNRDTGKH